MFSLTHTHRYQGRVVALKESIMADMCPESVDAIVAESEVLCRLSHTNIVRFFGVAFSPPNVVLVMPLLGPSLEETLARRHSSQARRQGSARRRGSMEAGPLPNTMLYYLAHDMASGMAYLHAQGIAHRDLKPANVLLTRPLDDSLTRPVDRLTRPRAMLCDFGISQWDGVLGAQLRDASRDDSMHGTFPYLPPESAQMKIGAIGATGAIGAVVGGVAGVGRIGAAEIGSPPRFQPTKAVGQWRAEGDVWAAGVIVWQCATLCVPWAQCLNRCDFVRQVNAIHPPRPGLVPPRLHGGFATLIEMCWEPDPIARPTSEDMKEFLETSSLLDNERREAMLMMPDRIPSVNPSLDAEMDGFSGLDRNIEGKSGSGSGGGGGGGSGGGGGGGRGRGSGRGSDLSRQSSRVSFPPRRGHGGGSGGHVRLTASEWDMDSILDGKRDSVPPVMIPGALPARTQSESGEGLSASLLSFGT
jgi:serine/threonine protein kinase